MRRRSASRSSIPVVRPSAAGRRATPWACLRFMASTWTSPSRMFARPMTRLRKLRDRVREELSDIRWRRRFMPPEYARPWRMAISDWLVFYYRDVLSADSHWMGVRSLKNPLDAWVYQEIVYET